MYTRSPENAHYSQGHLLCAKYQLEYTIFRSARAAAASSAEHFRPKNFIKKETNMHFFLYFFYFSGQGKPPAICSQIDVERL